MPSEVDITLTTASLDEIKRYFNSSEVRNSSNEPIALAKVKLLLSAISSAPSEVNNSLVNDALNLILSFAGNLSAESIKSVVGDVEFYLKDEGNKDRTISITTTILPTLISFLPPTSSPLSAIMSSFHQSYATTIASVLREILGTNSSLNIDDAAWVKMVGGMNRDNIPTLLYQLLLLSSSLPPTSTPPVLRILDAASKTISLLSPADPSDKFIFATTLSHFLSALRNNRELAKTVLKYAKGELSSNPSPLTFARMSLFSVMLMVGLSSSSLSLKDSAISELKNLFVSCVSYGLKSKDSKWIHRTISAMSLSSARATVSSSHMMDMIDSLISISSDSAAFETVASTLIDLGFLLIDEVKRDNKTPSLVHAESAVQGRALLTRIFGMGGRKEVGMRKTIVKKLSMHSTGRAPNAIEHAKLLNSLVQETDTRSYLVDFAPDLAEWLLHLATGGLPPKAATDSLLPALFMLLEKNNAALDTTFVFTKKSLFCADIARRSAGASFLVMIYTATVLYSPDPAAEEELLGYISRCLGQSLEMRLAIYGTVTTIINCDPMDLRAASALSNILSAQLERLVEEKEGEEEAKERRERGITLSQGEGGGGGLSQVAQDANIKEGCPVKLDLIVQEGNLKGAGDRAGGTLALAKDMITEPLVHLLMACGVIVKVLEEGDEEGGELGRMLGNLRERVANTNIDTFISSGNENAEEDENGQKDHKRTLALSLTLLMLCNALALADPSTDTLAKLLGLREDALESAVNSVLKGDASKKSKGEKKGKDKKDKTDKGVGNEVLSDRATKAINEVVSSYQKSFLENGGAIAATLLGDVFADFLMKFGSTNKDSTLLHSNSTLRKICIEGSLDVLEHGVLQDLVGATVCFKLGPLVFSEFAALSHKKMNTSVGVDKSPVCVLALQGYKKCVEVMATIKHSMKPCQRLASFLQGSLEKAGSVNDDLSLTSHVKGALKAAKEGENRRGETFVNWEHRIIHLLDVFIKPLTLDMENDAYTGGLIPELIGCDMTDEAILLVEVVGLCGALVADLGERRRLGEKIVRPWSLCDTAFKGPLLLGHGSSGFVSVGGSSALKAMSACVGVAVSFCGGVDGDTRIVTYKKGDPIFSKPEDLEEIRRGEGFSTGFKGFWDGMANHVGDSFPMGCVGVFAASLMDSLGSGGNFEDIEILEEEFIGKEKLIDCIEVAYNGEKDGKVMGPICRVLLTALDTALGHVEYVLKMVGNLAGEEEMIKGIDMVGMRMLAVAEIASIMGPCSEMVEDFYSTACGVIKIVKKLYALNSRVMGMVGKGLVLGQGYCNFITEMSMRTTKVTAALLLTIQDVKKTGRKDATISTASIENHGKIVSNLVFKKERSDVSMNRYSTKLKSMKNSTLSNWMSRQIIVSSVRDFKINKDKLESEIRDAEEKERKKKRKNGMDGGGDGKKRRKVVKGKEGMIKEKNGSNDFSEPVDSDVYDDRDYGVEDGYGKNDGDVVTAESAMPYDTCLEDNLDEGEDEATDDVSV